MDFKNNSISGEFNNRVGKQFDDFMIFLNAHYISKRNDSEFWKFVSNKCIHDDTKLNY